MSLETDLLWKHIYKFASKFNLATICVAIPAAVKHQLEMDFAAAYPDLNFDEEWQKVKEGK